MQKIILLLLIITFSLNHLKAQSDCNPYYTFQKGKKWTTANYSNKDKYMGKQSFEILEMEESGNSMVAKTMVKSYDKKDKLEMEKEIEFVCEDGVIQLDMSQYLPAEMMETFKGMDVTMVVDPIEMPRNLTVGQELAGGGVNMTISVPMPMKINVTVEDRKVVSKENIKVPAGSFDTYKITATTVVDMMGRREINTAEWIAEGVGAVRTESYDKGGDLKYYTVLLEYSK